MVKHIVLYRLKDVSDADKTFVIHEGQNRGA